MSNLTEQPKKCSDWREKATKHLKTLGDLKVASGVVGLESLQDGLDRQNKSLEAEDRKARELLGMKEPEGDEDVGRQTIVGDVTQAPPVVVVGNQERSPVLGTLLGTALAIAVPGAGALGFAAAKYFGDKAEPVIIDKAKDTVTTLGLKRFSDLNLD